MILCKMDFQEIERGFVNWMNVNWFKYGYERKTGKFSVNKLLMAAINKYGDIITEEKINLIVDVFTSTLIHENYIEIDGEIIT